MLDTHVATIMVIAVGHQGNMKHIGLYAILGGLLGTTEHRIGRPSCQKLFYKGTKGHCCVGFFVGSGGTKRPPSTTWA